MNQSIITDINIHQAISVEEIRSCYQTLCQLRPYLTDKQAFIKQVQRQSAQGYKLAYYKDQESVKAVVGFRFFECLAWGKVLYIDDLITDSEARKNGYGGKLLKWIIEQAKNNYCDQIHLDSGPQRHDAHKLYLNYGFKITGHHFALNFNEP